LNSTSNHAAKPCASTYSAELNENLQFLNSQPAEDELTRKGRMHIPNKRLSIPLLEILYFDGVAVDALDYARRDGELVFGRNNINHRFGEAILPGTHTVSDLEVRICAVDRAWHTGRATNNTDKHKVVPFWQLQSTD